MSVGRMGSRRLGKKGSMSAWSAGVAYPFASVAYLVMRGSKISPWFSLPIASDFCAFWSHLIAPIGKTCGSRIGV